MKTVNKESLELLQKDIEDGTIPVSEYDRKNRYNLRGSDYDYIFNVDDTQQQGNINYLLNNGSAP